MAKFINSKLGDAIAMKRRTRAAWFVLGTVVVVSIVGLQALASPPLAAVKELLAVETQLAASRQQLAFLEGEVARLEREVAKQAEELRALEETLDRQQADLGRWLGYVYRRGPTPFLALLLRAESFGDFAAKYTLLSYLVRYGLSQVEATEQTLATVEQKQAKLHQEVAALRAKKDEAAATVARLAALQRERQAALARAEAEAAAAGLGAEEVRRLLTEWQRSLPALAYLVANFSRLPWQNLQPDDVKVDYGRLAVEAVIAEETIQRTLATDQPLTDLKVRVKPGWVYIEGKDFVLGGRLETDGERIRLVPQSLRLPGAEVGEEVLRQLFAAYDLSFPFATPYPGLRLKGVEAREGEIAMYLGFR